MHKWLARKLKECRPNYFVCRDKRFDVPKLHLTFFFVTFFLFNKIFAMSFFHTFIKHLFGHDSFEIYLKGINALFSTYSRFQGHMGPSANYFLTCFWYLFDSSITCFMANHLYNRAVVKFDKIEKLHSTLGCSVI